MKLIRKENGEYHLLVNSEIKSLQEFNITKEDCDILTLGYSVEKMAAEAVICNGGLITTENETEVAFSYYHQGFNAHKELVKDKLFTVEDLRAAFTAGDAGRGGYTYNRVRKFDGFDEYITKRLGYFWDSEKGYVLPPKTEWNVTFDEQGKLKLI